MSDLNYKVFVYGTLRRGQRNHAYLQGMDWVGACQLKGYMMLDLGLFPALIPSTDDWSVHGEVYRVSAKVLDSLDILEGVARNFYTRDNVQTVHGKAYLYTLHPSIFRFEYNKRKLLINDKGDFTTREYLEFPSDDLLSEVDAEYMRKTGLMGGQQISDPSTVVVLEEERKKRLTPPPMRGSIVPVVLEGYELETSDYPIGGY